MKTITFATLEYVEGTLVVSSPGQGKLEVQMSPDEILLFLVETHNALADGRRKEKQDKQERELLKEIQKRA